MRRALRLKTFLDGTAAECLADDRLVELVIWFKVRGGKVDLENIEYSVVGS